MKNDELYNENNEATYCPEDDKLRLYVGRVDRDEYLALKKEGWTSTPKQDCDFAAVWTAAREDTALSYAGIILDEDQSPTDRAADRAERFGEYLDKRREEAHDYADRYDAGPSVHGYQNHTKAVRAADRHDRLADRACDAWSKAEYWQRRTAGVISNALYKSSPSVRMGRIKKIESEIRKSDKAEEEYATRRGLWKKIAGIEDAEKQNSLALKVAGSYYDWTKYDHPSDPERKGCSLYSLLKPYREEQEPITGAEAATLYLAEHPERSERSRWYEHAQLRLAYERQMLEAAGGRAGEIEIEVGGVFGGGVIAKVNKSNATGRVTSVNVICAKVEGWAYKVTNTPGTNFALMQIDVERSDPESYKAPTEESRAKLAEYKAAVKAAKAAKPKAPSLINPTPEEAQRLQDIWNSETAARWERTHSRKLTDDLPSYYTLPKQPAPCEMTQEEYKARSKGSYETTETVFVGEDGQETYKQYYGNTEEGAAFKIRATGYNPRRVIVLTDKPQKKLPAFAPKAEKVEA